MIKQPTPDQIKQIRQDLKLTQAACAALVHVATRTWQSWEDGGKNGRGMRLAEWELFCIKTDTKPK